MINLVDKKIGESHKRPKTFEKKEKKHWATKQEKNLKNCNIYMFKYLIFVCVAVLFEQATDSHLNSCLFSRIFVQ